MGAPPRTPGPDVLSSAPPIRRLVWIAAAGLVVRLIVIVATDGSRFDILNSQHMLDGLRAGGLDAYGLTSRVTWPYGPGWFPWLLIAGGLNHVISFSAAARIGPALCDTALVLLVGTLARGGERTRLAAAAVMAFGPLSVLGSSWFSQLDTPAALASLLALWVWTRGGSRRAVGAGLLLALAAAIKTVPLLLVLPFALAARDRREGVTVAVVAVGGSLLTLLPFYLRTPDAVSSLGGYHGLPAVGGLSLVLQPRFAAHLLGGSPLPVGDLLAFLRDDATTIVLLPALLAFVVLLVRRPVDVLTGCCLTWLVIYVFGVNFSITYLGWAIPFFLVRGHVRGVLAVQLAVTPLTLLLTHAYDPPLAVIYLVYTAVMAGLWVYGAGLLAWLAAGRGEPVALADSPGATEVA